MTANTFAAARLLCDRRRWRLTCVEVNSLLYIATMFHAGQTGQRLLDAGFEAWTQGPIVVKLEDRIEAFGIRPVSDVFGCAPVIPPASAEQESLTLVCDALDGRSVTALVAMTRWKRSAWSAVYDPLRPGRAIPLDALIEEYRARFNGRPRTIYRLFGSERTVISARGVGAA